MQICVACRNPIQIHLGRSYESSGDELYALDPPFEGAEGEWVNRHEFAGRKSFGFFECESLSCGKKWYSAHAFPSYKQGCQECEHESLPAYLWVNYGGNERDYDDYERDDSNAPHDRDRCMACRAGVCITAGGAVRPAQQTH